jgi:predicted CXXCH cytochrome family protein
VDLPAPRLLVPASTDTPGDSGTEGAIVMCLSCHGAHATPYADILRWDYTEMVAGDDGSGGCVTCHTQKKC